VGRRRLGWGLVLLLALALLPPRDLGASAVPAQPVAASPLAGDRSPAELAAPPGLYGIAGHAWWLAPHFDRFLATYRDLGVTGVRLPLDWKAFEPQEGRYDFAQFDYVLPRLAAAGLEITAVWVTVPPWASSDPAACRTAQTERCDLPAWREPQMRAAARAAIARYPFIRRWEVGNEPEMWRHLGNNPVDYLRVLRPFYAEAKAANPDNQIAVSTILGWDYVRRLADQAPERPWDAVAFHAYGGGVVDGEVLPRDVAADDPGTAQRTAEIERLRTGMVEQGDGQKPVWITEYGWQRHPRDQAEHLRAMIAWMAARPWITTAHLHMLHDTYDEYGAQYYGLLATLPTGVPIGPQTQFVPKQPFYDTFRMLSRGEQR
jgi:polysaccharide biosynthesis protein PslG